MFLFLLVDFHHLHREKKSNHSYRFENRSSLFPFCSEVVRYRVEDPSVFNELLDNVNQPTEDIELLEIPTGNLDLTYVIS